MSGGRSRRDFSLRDIDCVTCALRLEKELRKVPGVKEAEADLLLERVTVIHNPLKGGRFKTLGCARQEEARLVQTRVLAWLD